MSEYDSFEDYVFSLSDERFSFLVQAADKRLDSQLYGVTSFEEAALKYERKPVCPDCGSLSNHEDGYTPAGHKRYRCQDCSSSFPLLSDTIFNSAKISLHKLMSYIQLMSFNVPLQLLCEVLSISSNTAELWRKKIFETVNGYQDHLKLYGTIWIDETYLNDYSILHDPLEKRKRGLSKNLICIVTAVDSYKNMVAIISGHGKPSSKRIKDVLTFFALSITGFVYNKEGGIIMAENKAMEDNDLEKIAGGHIFKNYSGQYEVINEIGNVVETYNDLDSARKTCADLGFSTDFIEWDDLYKLREENGQNEKRNGINIHYPNPFFGK